MNADLDLLLLLAAVGRIVFDSLKYLLKLLAEEHGNDRRRRFGGAEAMVVGSACNGYAQHILIIVNRLQNGAQQQQKLRVLIRSFARLKKI